MIHSFTSESTKTLKTFTDLQQKKKKSLFGIARGLNAFYKVAK